MTESAVIELTGLTKRYRLEALDTYALREVNLRIERGEFVAVTGPSGCGKSTLMAILGLLLQFDQGRYRLAGRDVSDLDGDTRALVRNRHIGFVFQAFNLIGELTVLANVALPLKLRGGVARQERERRARAVLARVGLEERLGHYPHQLSGGQQQRVAIARALVGEPDLILADEPTGNLDSHSAEAVMALLAELNAAGTTLCLVTHDAGLAARAGRIVPMLDGRMR
jgi:putative ABC transport system ATP-binding protein